MTTRLMFLAILILGSIRSFSSMILPVQIKILTDAGFTELPQEKEPFSDSYRSGYNEGGISGLITLPTARDENHGEKVAGFTCQSYLKINNPSISTAQGTPESYDILNTGPFFSWNFHRYLEMSISSQRKKIRYTSSKWASDIRYSCQETILRGKAFYPLRHQKDCWAGLSFTSSSSDYEPDHYRSFSLLFSQELFRDFFFSMNYTTQNNSLSQTVHWQEAGIEAVISKDASLVVEARRSSAFNNFRDMIINSGIRLNIQNDVSDIFINIYGLDLNKVSSSGVLGAGLQFTFR